VDNGPWTWAVEAYVYGRAGQQAQARRALEKVEQGNRRWHLDPAPMYAVAYAGMNQNDEAIAWLDKAFAQHSNLINALKVDPVYDPLRRDPRFQDLLRRVGWSTQ
jgi:lipopolysaccharide biosynthesis regulator YciM